MLTVSTAKEYVEKLKSFREDLGDISSVGKTTNDEERAAAEKFWSFVKTSLPKDELLNQVIAVLDHEIYRVEKLISNAPVSID